MPPTTELKEEVKTFLDDLDRELGGPMPTIDDKGGKPEDKPEDKGGKPEDKGGKPEDKGGKPEDKPEDKPDFTRPASKKGVPKDESVAALRKQRDEERERNKAYLELFGENKPEAIKPLFEMITEIVQGPITPESVVEIVTELKGYREKISKLEQDVTEKEKKVTELDIRFSDDFKKNYEGPYKQAMESLFLEFASVAPDKTIVAPIATKAFNEFLVSNPDITGLEVKTKLAEFAREFKKESGEDALLPSVTSLMNSIREFKSKRLSLQEAYVNWKTKKEEDAKRAMAEGEIQTEAQKKAARRKRVELAGKSFREFDLDALPFVDEKKAREFFDEEFKYGEKIFNGEEVPEYDAMIQRGVKARLWDEYHKELIELKEFKEKHDKGERNNLPGSGGNRQGGQGGKTTDWLTGQ